MALRFQELSQERPSKVPELRARPLVSGLALYKDAHGRECQVQGSNPKSWTSVPMGQLTAAEAEMHF